MKFEWLKFGSAGFINMALVRHIKPCGAGSVLVFGPGDTMEVSAATPEQIYSLMDAGKEIQPKTQTINGAALSLEEIEQAQEQINGHAKNNN